MKATFYFMICLLTAVAGMSVGCSSQDEKQETHFGPNPNDGVTNQDKKQESHFGPNPGDGLLDRD